jgi:hypothetical protein
LPIHSYTSVDLGFVPHGTTLSGKLDDNHDSRVKYLVGKWGDHLERNKYEKYDVLKIVENFRRIIFRDPAYLELYEHIVQKFRDARDEDAKSLEKYIHIEPYNPKIKMPESRESIDDFFAAPTVASAPLVVSETKAPASTVVKAPDVSTHAPLAPVESTPAPETPVPDLFVPKRRRVKRVSFYEPPKVEPDVACEDGALYELAF